MYYTDCVMMMGVSMTNEHFVIITAHSLFFYVLWVCMVFIRCVVQFAGWCQPCITSSRVLL